MAKDETTTKFRVDISELKKEFQDAQRHIRLVNSEFKAATAGMDRWTENADGLTAKITQLNGVLEGEEAKLRSLEKQYALVAQEQGENSKGAQELAIKINNQKAAVDKVKSSIGYYSDKLKDLKNESEQVETATDQLRNTINKQESGLNALKEKYAALVLEQGKSSKEAKETAKEIGKLSAELKQNKTALSQAESAADEFDKSLDNLDDGAGKASEGFTVMKGVLADLIADGIKAAAGALKDFVFESDSAYKSFQAQTGATTEEMKAFKDEMNDLYKNNFGESLQDIGDKMAYVKQVTGEVDPSKIRELTENAIALEDTFGSDFNETIRGVNNLMQHFGIDAEEAFDLFAKGSQLGLDYTDELGDNIAEYGGNFAQAGYSAEEYFQLLVNGSQNGAYNLDKVNDSINEVKNRLGDGTIEKNINIFSDGTKAAFDAWESGKGTMKDVIDSIVNDINNCENEQEALNMAATAFGTMGEDANLKVVKSLKSTGDAFKDVKGSMEDVKKVKYDDIQSEFASLGRTIQLDVIAPLGEKALPAAKKFVNWCVKNINKIIPIATAAGAAIASIFVVNTTAKLITSIQTIITTITALQVKLAAATASSVALSTAMKAIPYVAVAAGVAGLVAAAVNYEKAQRKAIEQEYGLSKAQKESIENAKELKKTTEEANATRLEATAGVTAEYGHLTELKNEYNSLIDSNGQVKAGYEDRANYILTTLAQALGLEKDQIMQLVDANGQLSASIDTIIQKKQAEATLSANEPAYTEAIQNRTNAVKTYQDSLVTLQAAEEKYNAVKEKGTAAIEKYQELLRTAPNDAAAYYNANKELILGTTEAEKAYTKAKQGAEDAETALVNYNTTIANYEGLSAAILSGDAGKIKEALVNMQNAFITAETGTRATLEQQVKNLQENADAMQQAVNNGTPGVTQAMADQAQQMVEKAKAELDKLPPEAEETGKETGSKAAKGLNSTSGENEKAAETLAKSQVKGLSKLDAKKKGTEKGKDFSAGTLITKGLSEMAGTTISNMLASGLVKANTKGKGEQKATEYANGASGKSTFVNGIGAALSASMNSGLGSANTSATGVRKTGEFNSGVSSVDTYWAGQGRANRGKAGFESVSAYSSGNNFTAGFVGGIGTGSAAGMVFRTAFNIAQKALAGLKAGQREGSPSKLTFKSGTFFWQGYVNAIAAGTKRAIQAAKELGKESVAALNAEMEVGIAVPQVQNQMRATRSAIRKNSGPAVGNTQVVNNYNFTQTNNSPKPLSRLEIYRQTKNQLNFAKGV